MKKHRIFIGLILSLAINLSYGQKLNLGEILTMYNLDSTSLIPFCKNRQFELVSIKEDNWGYTYSFHSITDKKISFIRTFSKKHSYEKGVFYYYDDKKDYKSFKDSLKMNGFEKFRTYEMFPDSPNGSEFREGFGTDSLELELSTSSRTGPKRCLLLYKRVNFK